VPADPRQSPIFKRKSAGAPAHSFVLGPNTGEVLSLPRWGLARRLAHDPEIGIDLGKDHAQTKFRRRL
jgi:hypothetical protein